MKTRVIGIAGYRRSGKDTFCSALETMFPKIVRLAIADEIKRELSKFLGVTVLQIEDFKDPYYRKPLQDLGSYRRRLDNSYWLSRLCNQINGALDCNMRVVVPDVRIPFEAQTLRERFFAQIVRVRRKDQGPIDNHDTERLVDDIQSDYVYDCGSPEEVTQSARELGHLLEWNIL